MRLGDEPHALSFLSIIMHQRRTAAHTTHKSFPSDVSPHLTSPHCPFSPLLLHYRSIQSSLGHGSTYVRSSTFVESSSWTWASEEKTPPGSRLPLKYGVRTRPGTERMESYEALACKGKRRNSVLWLGRPALINRSTCFNSPPTNGCRENGETARRAAKINRMPLSASLRRRNFLPILALDGTLRRQPERVSACLIERPHPSST